MELKEAIEKLKRLKYVFTSNIDDRDAIDTVLKELNNRIPISEIEKILEEVKKLREKEINELGMSLKGSAVDILEGILKNYKE